MSIEHNRIAIPGTSNLRDLGGYRTANATMIAPRRLFRSEVIVASGDSELQGVWESAHADAFVGLGIRTVIDLRAAHEVTSTPSAWAQATGADVVALPIAEGGEGTDTNYVRLLLTRELARFDESDMADFYCDVLDRRAMTIGAAVQVLTGAGRLPALVHCSAGKDRTGLLVAVVLEVLGVPRAVTVVDYALTGVFRPKRIRAYAHLFEAAGVALDDVRVLFETPASAMEAALAHLDERYGGASHYLVQAGGLTVAELAALRDNLLIAGAPASPVGT
jgi:protein-tyrosine phosphatase